MRIRESAYITLLCLFFSVYNSSAQSRALELYNGCAGDVTSNNAGSWDVQFISQPKLRLEALQAGSKAIFSSFTECEIYDFESNQWQTHQFIIPRRNTAAIASGHNAFFAGGARGSKHDPQFVSCIDIYNTQNNSWYNSRLSEAREVGGAGTYGNVVIFAGGITRNGYSSRVDIFNTQRPGRKHHKLSEARSKMTVGAAGNKIVFAGGLTGDTRSTRQSNAVDIYEVHSNTWSMARLSDSRYDMSVAAVGNRIIFAGGLISSHGAIQPSNTIDIYDAVSDTWRTATLSEAKHTMSVAVVGTKVYFAGGLLHGDILSDKLEVYDMENDSWTTTTLPSRRHGMAVSVVGSRVMFAGGYVNDLHTATDRIEVLDLTSDTWSTEHLSKARTSIATASYKNSVIFAGGRESATVASATVDIWHETQLTRNAAYPITAATNIYSTGKKQLHDWIYADPHNNNYIIADLWRYETQTVNISILNAHRRTVLEKSVIPLGDTKEQIDVSELQQGKYWVLVACNGRRPFIKQVDINSDGNVPDFTPNIMALATPNTSAHYFTFPQH